MHCTCENPRGFTVTGDGLSGRVFLPEQGGRLSEWPSMLRGSVRDHNVLSVLTDLALERAPRGRNAVRAAGSIE